MSPLESLVLRLQTHLEVVYGEGEHQELVGRLIDTMRLKEHFFEPEPFTNHWDEKDVALITYGDSIMPDGGVPLAELKNFLDQRIGDTISILHILPFFPWSSDDGFAVSNYLEVHNKLGDWEDIDNLANDYRLMSDLVVNHCSASHPWFEQFVNGEEPGRRYFFTASPEDDLSDVVRPRSSDLLRETETKEGIRFPWCTFGHDQIDFDFRDKDLLVEIVKIIRNHLDRGVGVFRLDAIAFIWKEIGTPCINHHKTHELVRLFRTLIEHVKPDAVIITETNIPNQENLSYFGNGNEAHCIYNFALPPLLLHGLVEGTASHLVKWLMKMPPTQPGNAYFNFIASHDGIGLRPVENILSDEEVDQLVSKMRMRGGLISERSAKGGLKRPYEINISLYDAFQDDDGLGEDRFLCAHAILLALEGIPAIYIHSFLGTGNDLEQVRKTDHNRHINRRKWNADELNELLDDPLSTQARILGGLQHLIKIKRRQPAFHPNATQFTLHLGEAIFGFWRQSNDQRHNVFCLHNVTGKEQTIPITSINLDATEDWFDLLTGNELEQTENEIHFGPYQAVWLANRRKHLPY